MKLLLRWRGWFLGVALLGGAAAQAGPSWRCQSLDAVPVVAMALAYERGFAGDAVASGLAQVEAELRLRQARAAAPQPLASGIHVGAWRSGVFAVVAADRLSDGAQFLAAFAGAVRPTADAVALQLARGALQADDADWLYPGLALRSLALRRLPVAAGGGRGLRGDARVLVQVAPEQVLVALEPLRPVAGWLVGALPVELPAAVRAALPELRAGTVPPPPGPSTPFPGVIERRHPRVDGPFVALAFAVPGATDRQALAIGVEVARARAATLLPPRPQESLAQLTRVAFDWLDGDPLVVFAARGPNGAAATRPRHDLQRLLANLEARPPQAEEVAAAGTALAGEHGLWPWSAAETAWLVGAPDSFGRRVLGHAMACGELPTRDQLAALAPMAVAAALRRLLAAEPLQVAILPMAGAFGEPVGESPVGR